jgi:DNA polymerase III epsilon subunit-like protein
VGTQLVRARSQPPRAGGAPAWAICDTETTGLSEADEPIPPEVTAVHGLSDTDVAEAPTFTEVYPQLVAAAAGKRLLAYNAPFDQMILDSACRRHQLPLLRSQGVQWVDVMQPYADWAGDWDERRGEYRWQPLPHLSPDHQEHSALGDCQAVLDLLHFLADQPAGGDHRSENADAGNARQKAEAYRG